MTIPRLAKSLLPTCCLSLVLHACTSSPDGASSQPKTDLSTNAVVAKDDLALTASRARSWLTYAIEHSGEEYLRARNTFLDRPAASLPILLEETNAEDWRRKLIARAIAARIHSAPLIVHAEELLVGQGLPPPRNITGKHLPETLAKEIAKLGEIIDPWLFESLVKIPLWRNETELVVLFFAITERNSKDLVPMLWSIVVDDAHPIALRSRAVLAAVRTGDEDTWAEAHKLAKRPDAPAQLRKSAIFALAERAGDALPDFRRTCESIVLDLSAPTEVRVQAISAVRVMSAQASLPVLYQAAHPDSDDEVYEVLCTTFAAFPDPRSAPVIKEIGKKVTSPDAERICKEALEDLEWKLTEKGQPG